MLSFIWRIQPTSEPQFADYPTPEAYREAWYTWRAIQRDGRLNPEEMAVQWEVIEDALKNRPKDVQSSTAVPVRDRRS